MSKILEIGPGRGDFLFHLAEQNPLSTVVGVEIKKKRFDKLSARVDKKALGNVRLYLGDARIVLPQEFEDSVFDAIYILFSDPWPKRRHARHRLFHPDFVTELLRILKPEGQIYVAHDDDQYLMQIRVTFQKFRTSLVYSDAGIDFRTFYADKWLQQGRHLRSFSYRKIGQGDHELIAGPCVLPEFLEPEEKGVLS